MPPHDGTRALPPRPSRGHQPSFSAALLDAIYHSLEADAEARTSTEARRTRTPASSPAPLPSRRRPTLELSPSPSPSPSRSSVRSPRLQRAPRPCRVRPDPQPNSSGSLLLPPPLPPHPHEHEPSSTGHRRVADAERKRGRGRKSKRTAPFACLLNALLCNRRPARPVDRTPRATATPTPTPATAAPEPASARSILSSRASRSRRESAAAGGVLAPARRAVRFSPVATVVGDGHGHGAGSVGTATTGLRAKESAAEAERRVEELLRALGVADERERAKESTESSSDLFELDSLPAFQDRGTDLPRSRTVADGDDGAGLLARPRPRVQ
ncbi:hypothetical protein Zm00014a_014806 [Zea mays]|uniref:Uncharacterized protein n=1 Tax=Zea mays TaxID=4577 RepID=A0A3L6EIA1_MAIZE|nr:hypothetical protein Zm00014a_014806 [Zea mays]